VWWTSPPGPPPVATGFVLADASKTRTQFHLSDFGLTAHLTQGKYSVDLIEKVAFGGNVRDVTTKGTTRNAVPILPPETFAGARYTAGLQVRARAADQIFAVVPELQLNFG
jgi:hypothetical protein